MCVCVCVRGPKGLALREGARIRAVVLVFFFFLFSVSVRQNDLPQM